MWVFEEQINGKNLTEIINEKHENVKYLPGINLGDNVVAIADVKEAAKDANVLVFVLPHQFVYKVCESLGDVIPKDCKAISLIKGLDYKNNNLLIFSEEIEKILKINCAALSGANIAGEVAEEQFGETTIACKEPKDGEIFQKLFHTGYFDVNVIGDWRGLQVCGALKNVVALGAGICDGLHYGNNTKSAVIRRGLVEMRKFGKTFFGGVHTETFFGKVLLKVQRADLVILTCCIQNLVVLLILSLLALVVGTERLLLPLSSLARVQMRLKRKC